jgi:hypothetical protein
MLAKDTNLRLLTNNFGIFCTQNMADQKLKDTPYPKANIIQPLKLD